MDTIGMAGKGRKENVERKTSKLKISKQSLEIVGIECSKEDSFGWLVPLRVFIVELLRIYQ
jgi:hypothetical protein